MKRLYMVVSALALCIASCYPGGIDSGVVMPMGHRLIASSGDEVIPRPRFTGQFPAQREACARAGCDLRSCSPRGNETPHCIHEIPLVGGRCLGVRTGDGRCFETEAEACIAISGGSPAGIAARGCRSPINVAQIDVSYSNSASAQYVGCALVVDSPRGATGADVCPASPEAWCAENCQPGACQRTLQSNGQVRVSCGRSYNG